MADESVIESQETVEKKTDMQWYVVHTYTGYENKVKENLERIIENDKLSDSFDRVVIPMEEVVEEKDGKEKSTLKKIFPGYVLVKMVHNMDTWHKVKAIRGVTGFVGADPMHPTPLSPEEVRHMNLDEEDETIETTLLEGFEKGDVIEVVDGPLEGFSGVVESVNFEKKVIKAAVSMFGRDISAELEYAQVRKSE